MVLAIVSMMFLGLADTFFISLLGTKELAAASFVMPVYMFLVNVALGMGMGVSSLTSRLIGEQKHEESARFVTDSQVLSLIVIICISMALSFLLDPLFRGLGATDEVMPHIKGYMSILLPGIPLVVLTFITNSTFRAIGHIKASAIFSTLMSLLNLLLDPVFIFGLGPVDAMGMPGAAVATIIAAAISWACCFYILAFQEKLVDFHVPELSVVLKNWKNLLEIAIPAIGANIMTPMAAGIMTAMIARYGPEAVAGFGVGARIEALSLLITFALSSTLPMFIGQNIGAGRGDRAYLALMMCLRFVLIFQVGVYVCLLIFVPMISSTFSNNPLVIRVIENYLWFVPVSYSAHAIVILVMVSLNVMKRPRTALKLTFLRLMVLYVPFAYVGSVFWEIKGLFIGAAIGNFVAGYVAYRKVLAVCNELGLNVDSSSGAKES